MYEEADFSIGPAPILTVVEPTQSLLLDSKDLADFDDEVELRPALLEKWDSFHLLLKLIIFSDTTKLS